jgi:hypothetical protein
LKSEDCHIIEISSIDEANNKFWLRAVCHNLKEEVPVMASERNEDKTP